jgi:NIPSNAP
MELELRRNRVRAGCMDELLDSWWSQVPPLRAQFGFELLGAWVTADGSELVWILGYDGPDGFDVADRRYYESPERAALDPDPAQWFESSDQVRLRPIDRS